MVTFEQDLEERKEDVSLIYIEDLVPDIIAGTKVCRWLVIVKERKEVLLSRMRRHSIRTDNTGALSLILNDIGILGWTLVN